MHRSSAAQEQRLAPSEPPPQGPLDRIADQLNKAIDEVPLATLACFVAFDIGTVLAANSALYLVGATPSAEFAVAYALSRVIKRFRLPIELMMAAPLAKAVPALPRVRVIKLMMPGYERPASMPRVKIDMDALRNPGATLKAMGALALAVVDKYGLAYNFASRFVGLGIVSGLYAMLAAGVDVQGWLEGVGFGDVGTAAGTFGLAVALTSAVYPATVAATAYAAHPLARAVPLLRRKLGGP